MTSKKVKVEPEENDDNPMDAKSDSDESSDEDNADDVKPDEKIIVDFEGRAPIDSDLEGIRQLLLQLFVKAHIDLNELAGLIIGQNYVGSVLKQAYNDEEDDDDEDEDADMEDPYKFVYGITTVVNLTNKQDLASVQQLQKLIFEKAEKYATEQALQKFREALQSGTKVTGLLLNERIINIPAAICVPMFETMLGEIERANEKRMPYNFDYYMMIVKYYQKTASGGKPAEVIFSNDEEEYFVKDAVVSFDYSVQKDKQTTALGGSWMEEDEELQPFRKVLLIEAAKIPTTVATLKSLVSSTVSN